MTQTSPPSLYAPRVPVFPRRVDGFFRRFKWGIMAVTLGIYYLTPWLRWDRGPNLPDQAVLIDLAHRRVYFFWIEIWPHEFYFVAGLLIMAGLGLFLFTSALGRVWCGYACPQTVWTDLFILVERWIEGDRNARVRLHHAGWSARKLRLRVTKWVLWLGIAVATGGAWVFYFTDAPQLAICENANVPPLSAPKTRSPPHGRGPRATGLPHTPTGGAPHCPPFRAQTPKGIASTAWPASTSAPWASTSATASRWSVSPAPCASTPVTM